MTWLAGTLVLVIASTLLFFGQMAFSGSVKLAIDYIFILVVGVTLVRLNLAALLTPSGPAWLRGLAWIGIAVTGIYVAADLVDNGCQMVGAQGATLKGMVDPIKIGGYVGALLLSVIAGGFAISMDRSLRVLSEA